MQAVQNVKFKMPGCDKMSLDCTSECSLGQIYDFSCALQAFVLKKMQDLDAKKDAPSPVAPPPAKNEE